MSNGVTTRGIYAPDKEVDVPYLLFDADHHFYGTIDALTRHLPREMFERAWLPGEPTWLVDDEGEQELHEPSEEDTLDHHRRTVGLHPTPEGGHGGVDVSTLPGMEDDRPIPGAMLNKLNPMRDLDQLSREQLVRKYNEMRPAFEKKEPRLKLMELQGVEVAVLHAVGKGWESAFRRGDVEAGYAVNRSFNDWLFEEWGYAHANRIFVPVPIPLADVDFAVKELNRVLSRGAVFIDLAAGPAWYGRSPFDPYFDPYWSIVNEANVRVAVHLGAPYTRMGAEWSENPNSAYSDFNGFQWVSFWGDRPIMDTVTAMMYHNLFGRYPDIKVLIAEFGTVWLPYLLRKLDHAMLLGRRTKWGELPGRPTSVFKERCVITPYPEENIQRPMEVVGPDVLVFGSDFPHSEGIPDPKQYVATLRGVDEVTTKKIMRDNLRNFIGIHGA